MNTRPEPQNTSAGVDVSIIFVNYRTSSLLCEAIRSAGAHTHGISYEIIAVDNATEDISGLSSLLPGVDVRTVQLPENVGFGRANNEGLRIASGRNILFLNPDTLLQNDAVSILSGYLDSHPDCGVCGGNLYDGNGRPTRSFRRIYPSASAMVWATFFGPLYEKALSRGKVCFNPGGRPIKVAYTVGAALMARRADLLKHGAFDPDFFMYYEEIELCRRLHTLGFKIVNVPQARITHLEGRAGVYGERKAAMHYRSAMTYFSKTLTPAGFRRFNAFLSAVIPLRITAGKILHSEAVVAFWTVWRELHKNRAK